MLLFNELKNTVGASFGFKEIEDFLSSIDVNTLTALSSDKSDIKIIVHDLNTGMKPKLGFSIKSMLGRNSTLFNAGNTTNFIYEIIGENNLNLEEINLIDDAPKIINRIKKIRELGFTLKFHSIQSKTLQLNLQLIDSDLPHILAELLLQKYSSYEVGFISILGERQNGKSFVLAKILNLSGVKGNHVDVELRSFR